MNLRITKMTICLISKACQSPIPPSDLEFPASRKIIVQNNRKVRLKINILNNSKAIPIVLSAEQIERIKRKKIILSLIIAKVIKAFRSPSENDFLDINKS